MYLEPGSIAWHRERQRGIGGSDLSALFGLSRFETPLGLWELKTNRRLYNPGGAAARRGTRLEPYVCRRFSEETGTELVAAPQFVRHPRWEEGVRLLANPDRVLSGELAGQIFEAKTTNEGGSIHRLYEEGRVPVQHMLQLQHYAVCLGVSGGVISCLVCPSGIVTDPDTQCQAFHLRWRRSETVCQLIETCSTRWWSTYVEADQAPDYLRHPKASELLAAMAAESGIDEYPRSGHQYA